MSACAIAQFEKLDGCRSACRARGPASRHVFHSSWSARRMAARFRAALAARGVGTVVHYPRPVHRQPAYIGLAVDGRPGRSEAFSDQVVSPPLYPELRDDEAAVVAAAVHDALSESGV